jgi:hypothetical protein
MYINTNIVFQSTAGFGAAAWCRDGNPVSICRTKRRHETRKTATPRRPMSHPPVAQRMPGTEVEASEENYAA